ncbi:MAG TPA: DUF262 domain-containing protein [Staphylococcus sp.]|nr:DUF262 domain-containing protein [Staphylococcus sp.]
MQELVNQFNQYQKALVIQQSDLSLESLSSMISNNIVNLHPHYQRRERWNEDKQSKLIESFILNVPVPPIYFSEDEYGIYSVIDGKQRLTAIHNFLTNKLKLKNLEAIDSLNNLYFKDLPAPIRNALSVRPYIRIVTLLKQSNPDLKYEVFLRLNTGGQKLNSQEVRNVAYEGSLNDLLFELSQNEILKTKLKITDDNSNAFRSMQDLEIILRFFALLNAIDGYLPANMSRTLDKFMSANRFIDDFTKNHLKNLFQQSIQVCDFIWEQNAFYKPLPNGNFRELFIAPLFDAQMIAVAKVINENGVGVFNHINKDKLIRRTVELLLNDKDFLKATTQATNNPNNIKLRVHTIYLLLKELI